MNRIFSFALVVVVGLVVGCGKKGDPSPPEFFAPASVANLTASAGADGVVLSWDAPSQTARGEKLIDLASFEIRRGVVVKGERTQFDEIAQIAATPDPKTGAMPKNFTYRDKNTELGKTYDYRIFAYNADGVTTGLGPSVRISVGAAPGLLPAN